LVLSVLERLVAVLLRGVLAPVPASVPTAKTFCELKSRSGGIPSTSCWRWVLRSL
jgi:hypothetical protein